MPQLNELTIAAARNKLNAGEISSADLTEYCLGQISTLDGGVNAFLDVWVDEARASAKDSDERRASDGPLSDLDGIPLAIKDNMLVRGKRCTAGSRILENYISVTNATVIDKLGAAGSVFLGKTNMDEFAMGSSTESSAYGVTHHPRDPERVPGGSSGGSAAAVASNMCLGALGSDTGGSIRQPASFCGIVGMKPTYGRVSRSGLIAMASSFDQIGPMTKTVEDAEILFEHIYGPDWKDQTTVDAGRFVSNRLKSLKGIKIGLPKQAWGAGIEKDVRDSVERAINVLGGLGASIQEIDLPYSDEALAVYYVVMPSEASTNLSRFDGMRYGAREHASTLLETYLETRRENLGPEPRRRIMLGTFALSRGYYDAYYKKAKQVQTLIRNAYAGAFEQVDLILTPTTPGTAFKIGEKINDPLAMYLEDLFTVGANVAGLPAISVPCGDAIGLPVGLHLTGRAFDEATLFGVARAYEQARTS